METYLGVEFVRYVFEMEATCLLGAVIHLFFISLPFFLGTIPNSYKATKKQDGKLVAMLGVDWETILRFPFLF